MTLHLQSSVAGPKATLAILLALLLSFYLGHIQPHLGRILSWLFKTYCVGFLVFCLYQTYHSGVVGEETFGSCAYHCNLNVLMGEYDPNDSILKALLSTMLRIHYKSTPLFINCNLKSDNSQDESGPPPPIITSTTQGIPSSAKNVMDGWHWGLNPLCKAHLDARWGLFRYSYPSQLVTFSELKRDPEGRCVFSETNTFESWVEAVTIGLIRQWFPFLRAGYQWPSGVGDISYKTVAYFYDFWDNLLFIWDFSFAILRVKIISF